MPDAILNAQGAVTIPHEIREHLGLKAGDKISFKLLSTGAVLLSVATRGGERARIGVAQGLADIPDADGNETVTWVSGERES